MSPYSSPEESRVFRNLAMETRSSPTTTRPLIHLGKTSAMVSEKKQDYKSIELCNK